MTPEAFIRKWKTSTLTERAASQPHFIDLCALLDEPTPTDSGPTGENYAFERGAAKTAGGEGWADVWKRGCFAWVWIGEEVFARPAGSVGDPPRRDFPIFSAWSLPFRHPFRLGFLGPAYT